MIFILAVRVREEAAAQTLTAARISPVRPPLVIHPLYQVSLQSPVSSPLFYLAWSGHFNAYYCNSSLATGTLFYLYF